MTRDERQGPRRARGAGSVYRKEHKSADGKTTRLDSTWTIQYYREGYRRDKDGNLLRDGAGRPLPARVRVREATGLTQRRRAQDLLTERLCQVAKGEYAEPQRHPATVEELLCALADHNLANGKDAENGLRRRRHLDPFFAGVTAARLTSDLVTRYTLRRQAEGAENATVNRELATLRRALNLGRRSTPPTVKTVPYIPLLREDNTRTGFVEQADFDKLTAAAASELWLRAFLELAYTYAWRKGELLKLRVQSVNLLTRKIRLDAGTTKNKQGREVTMTERVAELLRACVAGKKQDDYVLTRGHKPKRICDMRDAWQALCVRAGLGTFVCAKCGCAELKKHKCAECGGGKRKYRGLIPHDLRRSGAKALRRAGVPESIIMTTGGWKTASMFRRYAITSDADQRMAVELLERARKTNSPLSAPFPAETGAAAGPRAEAKVQ